MGSATAVDAYVPIASNPRLSAMLPTSSSTRLDSESCESSWLSIGEDVSIFEALTSEVSGLRFFHMPTRVTGGWPVHPRLKTGVWKSGLTVGFPASPLATRG